MEITKQQQEQLKVLYEYIALLRRAEVEHYDGQDDIAQETENCAELALSRLKMLVRQEEVALWQLVQLLAY